MSDSSFRTGKTVCRIYGTCLVGVSKAVRVAECKDSAADINIKWKGIIFFVIQFAVLAFLLARGIISSKRARAGTAGDILIHYIGKDFHLRFYKRLHNIHFIPFMTLYGKCLLIINNTNFRIQCQYQGR